MPSLACEWYCRCSRAVFMRKKVLLFCTYDFNPLWTSVLWDILWPSTVLMVVFSLISSCHNYILTCFWCTSEHQSHFDFGKLRPVKLHKEKAKCLSKDFFFSSFGFLHILCAMDNTVWTRNTIDAEEEVKIGWLQGNHHFFFNDFLTGL